MTVPTLELTEDEKEAKQFFLTLFEVFHKPVDSGTGASLETRLPPWFDEAKFKRGQKFYADNRFGILQGTFCSLMVLLADPKGLRILAHTGKSSTEETARKRYVSTFVHMSDWYECELAPGSKSWKSLAQVRRMHLSASNSAKKQSLGFINQPEMALTTFGFMGFPLMRPHLLGIRYDNREDREAFLHLWAVIGYMLGVEDRYNMCLLRLEVAEMICHLLLRYMFIPTMQLESPLMRQMIGAIVDGFTPFMPFLTYESYTFQTRRLVGIPGYQYSADLEKEFVCRALLTQAELDAMLEYMASSDGYRQMIDIYRAVFTDTLRLYTVKDLGDEVNQNYLDAGMAGPNGTYTKLPNDEDDQAPEKAAVRHLRELMGLTRNQELVVTSIADESEWKSHLNDDKLRQLSRGNQTSVRVLVQCLNMCYTTVGKFINESALSVALYRIRRAHAKLS